MTQLPALIAAIDSSQARFFTLAPVTDPVLDPSPRLIQQEGLSLPEGELSGKELWSSTKTGRNRGSQGQSHSYDDHRERHEIEFERQFGQAIGDRLTHLIQDYQIQEVLLIAAPQILGIMREAVASVLPTNVKINDLNKDLCRLSSHEIHQYLAEKDLLPSPQRVGIS
jgi:protein required for attachment to host cells